MPSTTVYRQGNIVLVSFPFTDLTSSKRRPALIISPDSFNAAGEGLVLAAITSHIADDPNAIQLAGAAAAGGDAGQSFLGAQGNFGGCDPHRVQPVRSLPLDLRCQDHVERYQLR